MLYIFRQERVLQNVLVVSNNMHVNSLPCRISFDLVEAGNY